MNKSNLFKMAHLLTKATIKAGDNYQVTFGAAVKHINSIHSLTGSDKQMAWADKIIANIITALKITHEGMSNAFDKNRTDVRALPTLNQILNAGIKFYINKYLSMTFGQLIALTTGNTYERMRTNLNIEMVSMIYKNIRRIEKKNNFKLTK